MNFIIRRAKNTCQYIFIYLSTNNNIMHKPQFLRKIIPLVKSLPAILGKPKDKNPFMVMDLAGDGKQYSYSGLPALKGRRVVITAYDPANNEKFCYKPGGASHYTHKDKKSKLAPGCTLFSKVAPLPGCLAGEASGAYDHIHFHMFWPTYRPFGEKEADFIVREINRLLKPGGLFFLSADSAFFSKTEKLLLLRDSLAGIFHFVLSRFEPWCMPDVLGDPEAREEPEVRDDAKIARLLEFFGYFPKVARYPHIIIHDFSASSGQAYYFAICEKPLPLDGIKAKEG